MPQTNRPFRTPAFRTGLALVAVALAAGPSAAQLHERGVARSGSVLSTRTLGSDFLCRVACSMEQGCEGWNWTRPGADGPVATCDLLGGEIESAPDPCCSSGQFDTPAAAAAVTGPALEGDRYAGRSTRPTGAPVDLVNDPTGGIWQEYEDEDADAAEDEDESASPATRATAGADPAQQARDAQAAQAESPAAQNARRGPRDRPNYSVQREYAPARAPVAQSQSPFEIY